MRTINFGITNLQEAVEDTFFDTCIIGTYSGMYDSFGDIQKSWIAGSGIACGVEILGGTETIKGQIVVTNIDARIRLPLETEISSQDRITITHRNDVAVSGISYLVRNIKTGLTCLVIEAENLTV